MSNLLSRQAESIFWMARQMERVNNLARILDVNETFNRSSQGAASWDAVLRLYDDEQRFFEKHDSATASAVIRFYVADRDNMGSIAANVRFARENARYLRPLISTEMWRQLNVFYNMVRGIKTARLVEENLSELCNQFKESCQTHTGIVGETLYRDEAWYFYQLGEAIERADQVTRLVDVKYQVLLPTPQDVGSALDVSQWNAVLRSAAGFQAFRRVHTSGMTPERVAGFLLFNEQFPRSLAACLNQAGNMLNDLRSRYQLTSGKQASAALETLRQRIRGDNIESVMARGMHEVMDSVQRDLIDVSALLGSEFFGHEPVDASPAGAQSQSQS